MSEQTEIPNDNDFQQQKLNASWSRNSAQTTVICLFIVAMIFIPIGAAVIVASDSVYEVSVRYDHINNCYPLNSVEPLLTLTVGNYSTAQGCRTRVMFPITKAIKAPIYMYYKLVGFYQNYREYADSRDDWQLSGNLVSENDLNSNCKPFRYPGEMNDAEDTQFTVDGIPVKYKSMVYNPCGTIPWSMFNDTISLYHATNPSAITNVSAPTLPASAVGICYGGQFDANGNHLVANNKCTKKGIALSSDLDVRMRAAKLDRYQWSAAGANSTNIFHANGFYDNELGHRLPNTTDEDLMVWMRTGGIANFRKLYRRIDADLSEGQYILDVAEFFPTAVFEGEKYVILATTTWIGGRNYVLGALFLCFGCLSFLLGIAFLLLHLMKKK